MANDNQQPMVEQLEIAIANKIPYFLCEEAKELLKRSDNKMGMNYDAQYIITKISSEERKEVWVRNLENNELIDLPFRYLVSVNEVLVKMKRTIDYLDNIIKKIKDA